MREKKFYLLGSKPFKEQISYAFYYKYFKCKKPLGRITVRERNSIQSYLAHINALSVKSLENISTFFRVKLNFWARPQLSEPPELIESVGSDNHDEIDLFITNQTSLPSQPEDLTKIDISTLNDWRLGFIPDLEIFTGNYIKKSIFYLLGQKLNQNPQDLAKKWADSKYGQEGKIKFIHEKHFINFFTIGFTIVNKTLQNRETKLQRIYQSKCEDFLLLQSRTSFHKRNFIDITNDNFNMSSSDYLLECPNEKCSYMTLKPRKLEIHIQGCEPGCKMTYLQRDMCESSIREFLVKEKFIPDDLYVNYAAFYDLEAFSVHDPSHQKSKGAKTEVLGTQRLVTLSVTANFGPEPRTVNFSRESFSKDDYKKLLTEFTIHLKKLQMNLALCLPSAITESLEKIENILAEDKAALDSTGKSILNVARKAKFQQARRYLESFLKLKVFGYNAERYDLCLLIAGLIELWGPENIDVIKRGNGYMMLQSPLFRFLDAKNYIAGGRLADFARSWGGGVDKGMFPYELYHTIDDAKGATEWPKYINFQNTLAYKNVPNFVEELRLGFSKVSHRVNLSEFSNQLSCPEIFDQSPDGVTFPADLEIANPERRFVTSPLSYCEAWEEFEFLFSCNVIQNMFEYLSYYCDNDTKILAIAFENYSKCFWDTFQVNPLEFFSLSQMSESIMYKEFDKTINRPYSLANGKLNQLIRNSNCGGLTIVFGRHSIANADLIEMTLYHKTVWSLANGQFIRKIVGFDFNSLYGAAMRLELPTGFGFLYEKTPNGFRWSSMRPPGGNGFSLEGVEWINYIQTLAPFTDTDGNVHIIRHALNGPEEEIRFRNQKIAKYNDGRAIFPDGYVVINGEKFFMFYDGCRWHNCNSCDTKCVQHDRDDERRALLSSEGTVISIKSCEWQLKRKTVNFQCRTSHFFRRTTLIKEIELLRAIEYGDIFGLVQVDIQSPPSVIEKWSKINFAPVIRHCEITADMIPDHILSNLKNKGIKLPIEKSLTVCFHGKQILLTTTMAQFFISQGMILSNIGVVVEFEKACPLKGFVNKATAERIKASRDNDAQKSELYKRVVNSSYGRSGMRTDNRVTVQYKRHSRIINSTFEKSRTPLRGEFETDLYEIQSEKTSVVDKIPVHLNFFILSNSKLIILKCLSDFLDHLDCTKVRLQYMDTDSLGRFYHHVTVKS